MNACWKVISQLRKFSGLPFLFLCFTVAMIFLDRVGRTYEISFALDSPRENVVRIYWGSEPEKLSEKQSKAFKIKKGTSIKSIKFNYIPQLAYIRIDPGKRVSNLVVTKMTLSGNSHHYLDLLDIIKSDYPIATNQLSIEIQADAINFISSGRDPYITLAIESNKIIKIGYQYYLLCILIILTILSFFSSRLNFNRFNNYYKITVIVPQNIYLNLSGIPQENSGKSAVVTREVRGENIAYSFNLTLNKNDIPGLITSLKENNSDCEIHLQVARSGEVLIQ